MKTTNEWISVRDKLPKLRQRINARFNTVGVYNQCVTGISYDEDTDGNFGLTIYLDGDPHHITHWQPLPDPPQSTDFTHDCQASRGKAKICRAKNGSAWVLIVSGYGQTITFCPYCGKNLDQASCLNCYNKRCLEMRRASNADLSACSYWPMAGFSECEQ